MQSSFRPVAFRLPLSEVAALADAGARAMLHRWRHGARLAFGFRIELRANGNSMCLRAAEAVPVARNSDKNDLSFFR
jgi:hypothetical protein